VSWLRAIATAVAIMAVSIVALAYVPDMIATNVHLSSGMRVALCVAFSNGALVAILVGLRRLQARGVI
jgi:hypothetical protein